MSNIRCIQTCVTSIGFVEGDPPRETYKASGVPRGEAPTTYIGPEYMLPIRFVCNGVGSKCPRWHIPAVCDFVRDTIYRFRWRKEIAFNERERARPENHVAYEPWGDPGKHEWALPSWLERRKWRSGNPGDLDPGLERPEAVVSAA